MSDSIFWTPPDTVRAFGTAIPREPAESDPNFIKHVYCDGARFHVLSWSTQGEHCSEPRCIINKRHLSTQETDSDNASFIPESSSLCNGIIGVSVALFLASLVAIGMLIALSASWKKEAHKASNPQGQMALSENSTNGLTYIVQSGSITVIP